MKIHLTKADAVILQEIVCMAYEIADSDAAQAVLEGKADLVKRARRVMSVALRVSDGLADRGIIPAPASAEIAVPV